MSVEPVPGEPAAVADVGERALVVADYHAGLEASLRRDGVELRNRAPERRERLRDLLARTGADRVVFLGDVATSIGEPSGDEREELVALFAALDAPATVVKGNHDGDIEPFLADAGLDVAVAPGEGVRLGDVGFAHGHTWPARDVLAADAVCVAHEHPQVRLEDEVGGARTERAWLRGRLDPAAFADRYDSAPAVDGDLVVFPAFNDLAGGTWVNVEGQRFLSPFLPAALDGGEAYLLDGTRLGPYRAVGRADST